jgi:hypothetical protein
VFNNPVNFVDPFGLCKVKDGRKSNFKWFSFRQFLRDTSKYAGIFAFGTLVAGPEAWIGTVVFGGIAVAATGLEIALYSEHPLWEGGREILKMLIPVNDPFMDKAKDEIIDQIYGDPVTSPNGQTKTIMRNYNSNKGKRQ